MSMNQNILQFVPIINIDRVNLHKRIHSDNQLFEIRKSVDVDELIAVITRRGRNVYDLLTVIKHQLVRFQSRTEIIRSISDCDVQFEIGGDIFLLT